MVAARAGAAGAGARRCRREANLTNERGVDGTTRLLKNVMGMWLLEECRRAWGDASYEELQRLAEAVEDDVPLFDPDDDEFLAPGDMPARIAAACERRASRAADAARPCAASWSRWPASTAG